MKQGLDVRQLKNAYALEKSQLLKSIKAQASNADSYAEQLNPFPIEIDADFLAVALKLQRVIIKAVNKIVTHYLVDDALQEKIPLSESARELITLVKDKEYNIGTLRPDFIIDTNNTLRICEINARFPLNGLFMTNYLANYFRKDNADYLGKNIISTIARIFSREKPMRIIKGAEQGYDIHFIDSELKKRPYNIDIEIISPDTLTLKNGNLLADGLPCEQFILELHQHELLAMPQPILHHLIKYTRYFNEIRTILIAHDKRLLSVLCDQRIMSRYMSSEEVAMLKKHIIHSANIDKTNKKEIVSNVHHWVFKKYLSGKGEGMYIGKNADKHELTGVLESNGNAYVAQHYIAQRKFSVLSAATGKLQLCDKYLVGMLISVNDTPLGVGFFRAGNGAIVNVATQGGEIIPII